MSVSPCTARCATLSRELGESAAATASPARTWLLLEQPGPWGPRALTASHLDPALGRALEAAASGTGVRVALIRRPGRHADRHAGRSPRQVYLAHTAPGAGWIREATVTDPASLLRLDLARLGAGHHDGFGSPYRGEPLVLVCTNGRRDRCCALQGRPLAAELAASGSGRVWETTHLGGHRFAPTLLVLPFGYAYARQDAASAKAVVEAARRGRMVTEECRGRTTWERPGQAADLAVRRLTGERDADTLRISRITRVASSAGDTPAAEESERPATDGPGPIDSTGWTVEVAHRDGRAWSVRVEPHDTLPARPESCGAEPGSPTAIRVRWVRAARRPVTTGA